MVAREHVGVAGSQTYRRRGTEHRSGHADEPYAGRGSTGVAGNLPAGLRQGGESDDRKSRHRLVI